MTVYYAIASGAWNSGSLWSLTVGGGAASHYPGDGNGTNDIGVVMSGYSVTYSATPPSNIGGFWLSGGYLTLNADMVIADALPQLYGNTCHILVDANTPNSWTTNGSQSTPRTIKSASIVPAHPIRMAIQALSGPETRTINLDYVNLVGFLPFLGNTNYPQFFNDPSNVLSPTLLSVTPLKHNTNQLEHVILGRSRSRIYQTGDLSGAVVLNGYARWDSHFATFIKLLKASRQRISFIGGNEIGTDISVPFCRIEGIPKFSPKPGQLTAPFSITLIEDW